MTSISIQTEKPWLPICAAITRKHGGGCIGFAGFIILLSSSAKRWRGRLTRGYYDAGEKDDPNSDDTRITYVFLLKDNDNIRSEAESDMDSLRAKYPEYFDLSTFKGLELYVWQMAPDSYSCGLMLGTNRNKTLEELMNLKGASIAEMRAILPPMILRRRTLSSFRGKTLFPVI